MQENIPREHIEAEQIEKINLGTDQDPKCILIGKACQGKLREDIIKDCRECIDVIACTYDQLKTYSPGIISHTIPLKPNTKPFRQK